MKNLLNPVSFSLVFLLFFFWTGANAQGLVKHLTVEYLENPLGIDIEKPRFSWQMNTDVTLKGQYQKAYQIIVTEENGRAVWDSKKIFSAISLAIPYGGPALRPMTRYQWKVMVWNEKNEQHEATAWFETGIMDTDPDSESWHNAQWIGGGEKDLVFYSHYLSVFKVLYDLQLDRLSKSTKASFVFGANDSRLMDKNMNIQGVENKPDQSYIRFELDISEVDGSEKGVAKFNVFRVGYAPTDSATKPIKSFSIPLALINAGNKYDKHTFYVRCNFGLFEVYLDEDKETHKIYVNDDSMPPPIGKIGFNLNPVGKGNDYISYPMLGDIGFFVGKGQRAQFSDVKIQHYRDPSNVIFSEDLSNPLLYNGVFKDHIKNGKHISIVGQSYDLNGSKDAVFVVADPSKNAAPMLRTSFKIDNRKVAKARLYVTARGIYEMYLNGKRIGTDYFNPGLTQYNKTHMYQTYDVTGDLTYNGENVLGGWLSEGWWSGNITYSGENWNFFGDRQSLKAQLVITFEDGSEQVVATNTNGWKLFTDGPIRYGSFFQGEVYDAQKEKAIDGWDATNYNDSLWKPTHIVPLEGTSYAQLDYSELKLIGQVGENAAIVKEITPVAVEEVRPGVFVYDMGQNMVGFPELNLPVGKAGDTITLRYAEVKYPNLQEYKGNIGMIMLENIRAALTQDKYIRKGGKETVRPRFTFHGYRFLEITGIKKPLPLKDVKGLVISSIKELASEYKTSNALVDKLWENITWSLRGNFLSIPTDTPARNERMGWSGDINVFAKAATYLAHVDPFLNRHMLAMRDIQGEDGRFTDVAPVGGGFGGTLWGSAGIMVAWEVYQQFGDLELLREHYKAMKRYILFLNGKIDAKTGLLEEGPLGDWLSPEGFKNEDTAFWAAYHLKNLEIMAKTAVLLDNTIDAAMFQKQYQQRKAFYNKTYVDTSTGKSLHLGNQSLRFGPPLPEEKIKKAGDYVDTQASYAIPLGMNVISEENLEKTVANLVTSIERSNEDEQGAMRPEYSLMTGFIGTASISEALSRFGEDAVAYRLLQQTSYPSWLYSVQNGATTIWERLNSFTLEDGFGGNNSMNSFNHYSFGAVAAWMYAYSLGIQRDSEHPGFKRFILKPTPDPDKKMTWAKGYYDSMYGRIYSAWRWEPDGRAYDITVPANTTAVLHLGTPSIKNVTVKGEKLSTIKGVTIVQEGGEEVILMLGSGHYEFKVLE